MNSSTSTRKYETTIEIDAPIDAVWKALSDADLLMKWFPPAARVNPGLNGDVWLSWGDGIEGEAKITIWEPLKRLQTTNTVEGAWSPGEVEGRGPWHITTDYMIEGRSGGGGTVLRLVHSGFGQGQGWENELDSISHGWMFELSSLKHFLERHWAPTRDGEPREVLYERNGAKMPRQQAWALLTGRDGLCRDGAIEGKKPGDRYRVMTAAGTILEGKVLFNLPPKLFAATVENLDDALIRVAVEAGEELCGPFVWMSVWGNKRDQVPALARAWRGVMQNLFGAERLKYWNVETA